MEISFAIIGTSGRDNDIKKLNPGHYQAIINTANLLIDNIHNNTQYKITHLVSGGAAWADHAAVKLFLNKKINKLKLFIPCEWDNAAYVSNRSKLDNDSNPGAVLNKYHHDFSRIVKIHSLSEIQIAKNEGAEIIEVTKGFFARNALVAKSDIILASTFGSGPQVKDSGTGFTVKQYLQRVQNLGFFDKSFHLDLNTGKLHVGCVL